MTDLTEYRTIRRAIWSILDRRAPTVGQLVQALSMWSRREVLDVLAMVRADGRRDFMPLPFWQDRGYLRGNVQLDSRDDEPIESLRSADGSDIWNPIALQWEPDMSPRPEPYERPAPHWPSRP